MALACLGLLPLWGCAADSAASAADPKGKVPVSSETISVFHGTGARQCMGGGVALSVNERLLSDAGVQVLSSSCGFTGRMHASVCGGATGEIHIFDIPASQREAARKLQFMPLSTLPGAHRTPCG